MKRALYFLMVVALIGVLPAGALGQSGITWDTEIFIQNLGVDIAYVTVYYYENAATGTGLPVYDESFEIPIGGSIRFFPGVAAGFNGSAVIESTEPIAAVVNEMGDITGAPVEKDYNAAYEGAETGAGTVGLTTLMSANSGFYSFFNVQNAGAAATTVTVDFVEEPKSPPYPSMPNEQCTIDPGEACTFSQEPGQGNWTGTKWVGAATITSSGAVPIVAAVTIVHAPSAGGTGGMSSYSGFAGTGSTTVIGPTVMNANGGFWSGINVKNVGAATTDITLSFVPEAGSSYPAIGNYILQDIAVNAMGVLNMPSHPDLGASTKWVGSVVVDGGGQNIFVLINTFLPGAQSQATSSKGYAPTAASESVYAPALMATPSLPGFWSGIQVYNTEATATDVTVTYSTCPVTYCTGGAWTPTPETKTVGPGAIGVWNQAGGQWAGKYYYGAAEITTDDGAAIVGLVGFYGQGWNAQGDVTSQYNALNR